VPEGRSFPLPDAFPVDVVVYVTPWCSFCARAKRLLERRGIPYETFDVTGNSEVRRWLVESTGQHTVPQIFIKGRSIGGFSELAELDAEGGLRL
jgi:glutaredoxin 3